MDIAKQTDWKANPFPKETKDIAFQREFKQSELEQLKAGFIPKQMEDKWFVYYDHDTLNFHRSWTGNLIYQIIFSHSGDISTVSKIIVNNDPAEYNRQSDLDEIKLVNYLIDKLVSHNRG